MKDLNNAVVVVTGASSGIGRATAHLFARQGATVVLAARRAGLLRQVEQECAALGGRALCVPTDTSQDEQVEALAARAVEACGRIDVWVNSAAVLALGRIEEIPAADHERLIRINLFGYLCGTRTAVRQFRRQGRGILVNNASVLGAIGAPYASVYSATKWAIRGLTESVRGELLDEPGIHACTVLPSTTDTPIFRHAANYTGREARAPEPVYSAERVAEAIVGLARRPRREVVVGGFGRLGMLGHAVFPALAERVAAAYLESRQFEDRRAAPGHGNLFEPAREDEGVSGGYRPLVWDRVERPVAVAALLALSLALYRLRRRR
ncbi:SDR family oxidoreductase [Caldimonas tepidiphila]|uniref:SDR family oxidoreductase n=1 Tax=Caldimonas tepidiphila TaxID=2315841 RepID=UPI00130053F1|nr:SDR family oxidoreductase [Caldimonas tepidiphila]